MRSRSTPTSERPYRRWSGNWGRGSTSRKARGDAGGWRSNTIPPKTWTASTMRSWGKRKLQKKNLRPQMNLARPVAATKLSKTAFSFGGVGGVASTHSYHRECSTFTKRRGEDAMPEFTAKYADKIQGVLSGFDRLVLRGSLRKISYPFGMEGYLFANKVLLKEFGAHVNEISGRVKDGALRCMLEAGRPVQYLASSKDDKEALARSIARKDRITQGPICALTSVEPCWGYDIHRNRETKKLDFVQRPRKCLYVYQYWNDPLLGWLNARIQTWFPFSIQICMNGREWLGRQMDEAGMKYRRQDNCFPWIADWEQAQRLMDTQLKANWPQLLNDIGGRLTPLHDEIFRRFPIDYYWSTYQSEWATDISFRKAEDLKRLYPLFVHHAMTTLRSPDILRFLGKKLTKSGDVNEHVDAEVTSDLKRRQEGVRIKHRYNDNSEKLYDKSYTEVGSILRAEMTMQNPEDFLVYRRPEGDPERPLEWLRMRKGIADLYH